MYLFVVMMMMMMMMVVVMMITIGMVCRYKELSGVDYVAPAKQ
jgi:hypothetical protein